MRLDQYLESPAFRNILLDIARKKLAKYFKPPLEADDLVQIALVEVWRRRDQYDRELSSPKTFAHRFGDWAMRMELRRLAAAKRDFDGHTAARFTTDNNSPLARDEEYATPDAIVVDYRQAIDDHLDFAAALAALSDGQKRLCRRLKDETPAEIAAADGVHRSTIYRQVEEVRRALEAGGFTC